MAVRFIAATVCATVATSGGTQQMYLMWHNETMKDFLLCTCLSQNVPQQLQQQQQQQQKLQCHVSSANIATVALLRDCHEHLTLNIGQFHSWRLPLGGGVAIREKFPRSENKRLSSLEKCANFGNLTFFNFYITAELNFQSDGEWLFELILISWLCSLLLSFNFFVTFLF